MIRHLVTKIRRRLHRRSCLGCKKMALVVNEVYGDNFEQIGWEWDCPHCGLHFNKVRGRYYFLDKVDNEWKYWKWNGLMVSKMILG